MGNNLKEPAKKSTLDITVRDEVIRLEGTINIGEEKIYGTYKNLASKNEGVTVQGINNNNHINLKINSGNEEINGINLLLYHKDSRPHKTGIDYDGNHPQEIGGKSVNVYGALTLSPAKKNYPKPL